MARFIIDNLIYDTEKAEYVCNYRDEFVSRMYPHTVTRNVKAAVYKTVSGRWFITYKFIYGKLEAHTKTVDEIKDIFKWLNADDLYAKYFEELQEA